MTVVSKFGGGAVKDESSAFSTMRLCAFGETGKYLIFSAPGKRYTADEKVTDTLKRIYRKLTAGEDVREAYRFFSERMLAVARASGYPRSVAEQELLSIWQTIGREGEDYCLSRGEYLTAKMMAFGLGLPFVDAEEMIETDGERIEERSALRVREKLLPLHRAVIPGFYGVDGKGKIKLLPRGGSDTTGAFVAVAIGADLYEKWTDVRGLYTVDPDKGKGKKITKITFDEYEKRGYHGILQEECVRLMKEEKIPIRVRGVFSVSDRGTLIVAK